MIQLKINGEMQSNASDVTVQFLAEVQVYTTLSRHHNICKFLGSLANVGMVLSLLTACQTLCEVIITWSSLTPAQKIEYYNQRFDGLNAPAFVSAESWGSVFALYSDDDADA